MPAKIPRYRRKKSSAPVNIKGPILNYSDCGHLETLQHRVYKKNLLIDGIHVGLSEIHMDLSHDSFMSLVKNNLGCLGWYSREYWSSHMTYAPMGNGSILFPGDMYELLGDWIIPSITFVNGAWCKDYFRESKSMPVGMLPKGSLIARVPVE